MKKTKRLISVLALLLAALMLFTSCAVSYSKANPAEYVSLKEGFDFANIALGADVTLDKMIVEDSDVTAHINNLLYVLREAVTDGTNKVGAFAKYDMLTIRNFVYDLDGNLIESKSNFALSGKVTSADTGTINLGDEVALPLGYGDGVNTALRLALEKAIFLDPTTPYNAEDYLVVYRGIGGEKIGTFGSMPSVGYVTYSSTYTGQTGTPQKGGKGTDTLIHFAKIAENIEANGKTGSKDYKEAIYLGLKTLIESRAEDNLFNPEVTKTVTINVYPTATGVPENAVSEADSVHIAYDIDFADGGTDYMAGKIEVTLTGAVAENEHMTNPNAQAFISRYTFPSDETGKYKGMVDGEEKELELKDREVVVYTYIFDRSAYTRPEYNAETVKTKLEFETDLTEDAAVIEAYEAHIKTTLQDECDATAKAAAKDALWEALMANTSLIKEPKRNIKNYVNEVLDYAMAYWIDGGYSTEKSTAGGFKYDDFEDFLLTYYCTVIDPRKGDDGKTISYKSRAEFEAALYEEGRNIVKNNLLTYLMADKMNCRYTESELLAMAKTRGTAWAKEQIEAGRKEILEYFTVENLTKLYPDEKATSTSEKTQKQQLLDQYGATSYEDCLAKILAQYGYDTWDAYAKAAYPDDYANWEDYVEYREGEENLYGTYHFERVLEKLYELNEDNIKYNEIAYKA